jgi:hypothetical protein
MAPDARLAATYEHAGVGFVKSIATAACCGSINGYDAGPGTDRKADHPVSYDVMKARMVPKRGR